MYLVSVDDALKSIAYGHSSDSYLWYVLQELTYNDPREPIGRIIENLLDIITPSILG